MKNDWNCAKLWQYSSVLMASFPFIMYCISIEVKMICSYVYEIEVIQFNDIPGLWGYRRVSSSSSTASSSVFIAGSTACSSDFIRLTILLGLEYFNTLHKSWLVFIVMYRFSDLLFIWSNSIVHTINLMPVCKITTNPILHLARIFSLVMGLGLFPFIHVIYQIEVQNHAFHPSKVCLAQCILVWVLLVSCLLHVYILYVSVKLWV